MSRRKSLIAGGMLLSFTFLSSAILSAPRANADTSSTVDLRINVPSSCSLSPTNTNLTKTITPGTIDDIGTAYLKALCNDPSGFAIYAIGYTGEIHGDNNLRFQETDSTLSTPPVIQTGLGTSGSVSNWNMTVANKPGVSGNYAATIPDGVNDSENFTSPHIVPTTYTKIASLDSTTDQTIGTNLSITFGAYISPSQPAGNYTGKVKFTLVHPASHAAPVSRPATIENGQIINAKMKALANNDPTASHETPDTLIKIIRNTSSLPEGFTASDANTISLESSENPVYIYFDNTNNAGIMYVYTGGATVVMNPGSSNFFANLKSLTDISDLADWDASSVVGMNGMFDGASSLIDISALASWDTSSVNYTNSMFKNASSLTSLTGLASWDTSSIGFMNSMFEGTSSLTDISALSGWNTGSVTYFGSMFNGASSLTDISALADWDTKSATDMNSMFKNNSSLTSLTGLTNWDTSSVGFMNSMFEGTSSLTDISALSGWNTGSVTYFGSMFNGASSLTDISALADWNTGSATDMNSMFKNNSSLTNLNGLAGWDTGSVSYMNSMFEGDSSLTNISAIANWSVNHVELFTFMFNGVPSSTTLGFVFTDRPGSVLSEGTYMPNNT